MEIAKRHAALVKAMVLIAPALEMDNLKQVGIVRGYECSGGGGSMEPSSTNFVFSIHQQFGKNQHYYWELKMTQ